MNEKEKLTLSPLLSENRTESRLQPLTLRKKKSSPDCKSFANLQKTWHFLAIIISFPPEEIQISFTLYCVCKTVNVPLSQSFPLVIMCG